MRRKRPLTPARKLAEPTFEEAQKWWPKMRQPVTFAGVPGYSWQPAILWNTGLLFWPLPRRFFPTILKLHGPWGLMRELEGKETDALQVEFSFGPSFHFADRMDNTSGQVSQELLDGRSPVVRSRLEHDGLTWTCTVFCRLSQGETAKTGREELLTEVRWTAENSGGSAVQAQLACHLNAPHVALGYKCQLSEKALPYPRRLTWTSPLLLDDRRKARLAASREGDGEISFFQELPEEETKKAEAPLRDWGLATEVLLFRAEVPPRRSVSVRLVIPYFAVEPEVLQKTLRSSFDRALAKVSSYWHRELASAGAVETPDRILNDSFDAYLCHAMLATGRRPRSGHWILKTSPNNYEGLWGAHAAIAAFSMDLRGKHTWSRKVLESFLENQGPVPASLLDLRGKLPNTESEGFSPHPGFLGNIEGHMAILWAFYHGWILWAIGQHARLTGDWRWLRRHSRKLVRACEWIAEQRRRTQRTNPASGGKEKALSYGLLPASNAFDWGFGHIFWSDAHTYRGLRGIAECLAHIKHPRAKRYLDEAEEYRQDIITAVTRCRDASPPVPLDDGTTTPFVPMSVEMRDYFAPDWTYVACGALNLAWAGVVPADHELIHQTLAFLDAGRPLGEWNEEKKKYEGWDWPAQVPADEAFLEATRPKEGRAFLWRHKMCYEPGWIPQTFTFMERDDIPALLEHLYSLLSNGGQHVALRSPVESRDGVAWCQPGDAHILWAIRNMLVREEGNKLILTGSCPRVWLAHGNTVEIKKWPTYFGTVSARLESRVDQGAVLGRFLFDFRTKPEAILLRLRHPKGALPRSVLINGVPGTPGAAGNPARGAPQEWLLLPCSCRRLEVAYGEPVRRRRPKRSTAAKRHPMKTRLRGKRKKRGA